ncbi:hypothetical protein [Amycolatopsis cihanbeyliensis]|uniref:hypothetical protein n=1 Tax=Amycolatopsis cihanbeyliensis TaxID=1128664 RepID=UPI00115348FE|nr:hypothetical protein [Amycolatopsis cihanbeyliensis]
MDTPHTRRPPGARPVVTTRAADWVVRSLTGHTNPLPGADLTALAENLCIRRLPTGHLASGNCR